VIRRLAVALVVLAAGAVVLLATGADSGGGGYKVRAIFDSASFAIPGEDVKVAGVKVGKVSDLEVTQARKAAVTLQIDQPGFADFRQDARCTIRPQSLIGEVFVECTPTVPKRPGEAQVPALEKIADGKPGAGQRLLPLKTRFGGGTSSPVGLDLINDVFRLPERQRLSLIINELGTGLAGNGDDLREVIRRANPTLRELDQVLAILASQNRQLAALARNGDTVLRPLARDKRSLQDFVVNAREVAQATAARRDDLARDVELLPIFLAELRPTADRLGELADAGTPVLAELGRNAPAVNGLIRQLGPFADASRPAVRALGDAARVGIPAMRDARPLARDLNSLGKALQPVARTARALLVSTKDTGGLERFLDFAFYQATATNGYDDAGHYLRAALVSSALSDCGGTAGGLQAKPSAPTSDPDLCWANFGPTPKTEDSGSSSDSARRMLALGRAAKRRAATTPTAAGGPSSSASTGQDPAAPLLDYLVGQRKASR
jgi:phospholipid/cholesterol/gamma-HCH transport system substrate-binding protein